MKNWILIVIASIVGFTLGWAAGFFLFRSDAPQDVECCFEGEMCLNEEEWVKTSIGCVDDQAASAELLKISFEEELERYKLTIKLAECQGALKESRRGTDE